MFMVDEIKSGVLIGRDKYDWVLGANASFPEIDVKDWKEYDVEHEIQFVNSKTPYDTSMCVTYSALKSIAKLLMYLIRFNYISADNVKWLKDNGYFKNGYLNFSERYTGTLGETTAIGAYQYKVANGIKNFGLIPQDDLPLADNFQDNVDKKFITQANYDKGKEFIKRFPINYAWVEDVKELKSRPLQTIVRFANYNKPEDILKPEGTLNHAVAMVLATPEYNEIDDTYWQRYKRYHPDYTHHLMAYNITITHNNMDIDKFVKDNDKKWVRNYNNGAFGRILKNKLFVVETKDRAALILLDDKVRENGIQISNEEWEMLPKQDF